MQPPVQSEEFIHYVWKRRTQDDRRGGEDGGERDGEGLIITLIEIKNGSNNSVSILIKPRPYVLQVVVLWPAEHASDFEFSVSTWEESVEISFV